MMAGTRCWAIPSTRKTAPTAPSARNSRRLFIYNSVALTTRRSLVRLPRQAHRELDFSTAARGTECVQNPARCADRVRRARVIQNVECVCVEAQIDFLRDRGILDQARVHRPGKHAVEILVLKRIQSRIVGGALYRPVLEGNPYGVGIPELRDVGVSWRVGPEATSCPTEP